MADPESTIPNDTSDLEKLLQEALEDFGRPVLLPSEKERVRLESTAATTGECSVDDAAHSKDGFPSTSSPASSNGKHKAKTTTDAAAEDAFLAETEKEIDNVLAAIAQESPALAQQLRSLTDCAAGVNSSNEEEAMKTFSQFAAMFKETLKSVSNQAGVPTEELLDEDLNGLMENLDKLAQGHAGDNFNSDRRPDFSVPVNDVVKALLAKDVMYTSLQRCEAEFEPWLVANRAGLSSGDLRRSELQLNAVKSLLREYDSQTEGSNSDEHFQRIFKMIAELQDFGSFPEELMAKVNTGAFNVDLPKFAQGGATAGTEEHELEPPDCKTT